MADYAANPCENCKRDMLLNLYGGNEPFAGWCTGCGSLKTSAKTFVPKDLQAMKDQAKPAATGDQP